MQIRVETLAEVKRIKFGRFDTIFCVETEKEYYLEPNGSGLTPDDDDYIQAAHGANFRYVAMEARSTGGGGGGGGSPYPQQVITVEESRALTPADQGIIIVLAGGVTLTLPATADNGETYIIVATGGVTIDPNGNDVLGGFNTDQPFIPGMVVTNLVAIDVGAGLRWTAAEQTEILNYSNLKTYRRGDMVLDDDGVCLSVDNSNVGNPVTDITKWLKFAAVQYIEGEIAFSDLSFAASAAPSGLATGWYKITQAGKLRMLDIYLSLSGASTGVTAVDIGIVKASEIRGALVNATEDIFGTGHVMSSSGFVAATALTAAMYSPTNLEYIKAKFPSTNNLLEVRMQFVFGV